MGIQSWMVKSWPMVEWYLPVRVNNWPLFQHVATNVREQALPQGRRCGDTVWVGAVDGHNVGVSWDWVELRTGVVMLTDPNSIVCNISFLSAAHDCQAPLVALVSLNRFVRHLRWQVPVCAALGATSSPASAARAAPRPQLSRDGAPCQAHDRALDLPRSPPALRAAA